MCNVRVDRGWMSGCAPFLIAIYTLAAKKEKQILEVAYCGRECECKSKREKRERAARGGQLTSCLLPLYDIAIVAEREARRDSCI